MVYLWHVNNRRNKAQRSTKSTVLLDFKKKVLWPYETSVSIYLPTRRNIPEDFNLQQNRRNNVESLNVRTAEGI